MKYTKKYQLGGKTPKEIMEEARRNQTLEREAQRVDRAMLPDPAREQAVATANVATANVATPRYLNTPTVNIPQISNRFNTEIKTPNQTFGQAFAQARKAGLKEFEWYNPKKGKTERFTTELKEEKKEITYQSQIELPEVVVTAPAPAPAPETRNSTTSYPESVTLKEFIKRPHQNFIKLYLGSYENRYKDNPSTGSRIFMNPASIWIARMYDRYYNTRSQHLSQNPRYYQQGGVLKAQQGSSISLEQRYKEMKDSLNGVVNRNTPNYNEIDYSKLSPEFAGPLPPDGKSGYRKYLPPYLQGRALDAIKNKISDFLMPNRHQVNSSTYTTYKESTPFIGFPKEVRSIVGPNGQTSTMVIKNPNTSKADTTFIPPGYVKDPDLYPKFTPQDIREGKGTGSYLEKFTSPTYFPHIGKHQQGGKVEETNQEQLILDFALRYMKGLGVDESELKNGIPDEYIPEITEAFNAVANSTEFWLAYEEDPEATMQDYLASREDLSEEQAVFAKKGAKLKQLKSKQKRCKCGCKMTSQKEGGKLVSKCACGCDTKKK